MHNSDLWIAKFSRQDDRWNHPRVEHGLLRLAENCGISVADTQLETAGDRDILLVRRFDRHRHRQAFQRYRLVSALTLLKADEHEHSRWSYLTYADEIRRTVSDAQVDLRELFLRMCFNAAVSNIDDHPRNHAIIAKGSYWEMSPAYDIVPFPVIGQERYLAMTCGRFGRQATKENLVSSHGRFMLDFNDATALFDRVIATVRNRWREHMQEANVTESDCEVIAPAFVNEGLWHTSIH